MRVLVVDDEVELADAVARGLRRDGYAVDVAHDGADALDKIAFVPYDLLVLDITMPGVDGREVCRRVRSDELLDPQPRVLFLTARDALEDRVAGLDEGADDYLVKPFGLRELVARIRAVTRRAQAPATNGAVGNASGIEAGAAGVQDLGRLRIDRRAQRVHLDDVEIALTPKEFGVLEFLAEDPGALRRRTEILERVWDAHWYGPTKTVDAHVAALRRKLGDPAWIEAVRGAGFRLGSPA